MTTEEKFDLLLEMVADIYTVAERLADHVGLEFIRPAALQAYLAAQQGNRR